MQSDRFCQLFNRIDDSISIFELEECDLPGKLVEYNETMLHRLGYSPEELRDLSLEKIFAPENAEMVAEFIRRLQLYRHVLIDLIEITKTGERIPVEINARFIEFEERQVLMVISRNTALREEMEEKLVYIIEQVGEAHLQTQILSRRLVAAQEEERRKIAMELHDEIGQSLTGLKLILEIAQRERHGETFQMLGTARQMVDELMGKISHLSLELRPPMLDELGLLPTLLWSFEQFTNRMGVQVAFRHVGLKDRRFGMDLELAVYRIIQEALTNVARHANVAEAMVYVGVDQGFILVQIEDKGVGFKVSDVMDAADSYGLIGMRERANMVGGTLTVDSIPGEGTLIEGRFLIIAGVYRKGFKLP